MKKNLNQVVEASKQFVYPSEIPQALGSTTLLRFKMPKLANIFSGSQSCLVLNFNTSAFTGIISMGSLLSCLQRASLLIGGQRIINIEECGKYLNHRIRSIHTASELKDLGTYIYGLNDNNILVQTFPAATYNQVSSSDFSIQPKPALQIFTTANDNANFQLQVPLSLVFDIFANDFPMYMLLTQDLVIEIVVNNTVLNSLINTTNLPTALNLVSSNTYVYGVYYMLQSPALLAEILLPYTDVFFTSQSFSAVNSANMSWTLANNRVKKIYAMAQTGNDNLLGGYNSSFIDSGNVAITAQMRYNDNTYWTEPIVMDGSAYQYLSECGKHGFPILQGRYTISDSGFLSNFVFSLQSAEISRNASGDQNILGINMGKVPSDCFLYDMSGDMQSQVFDTNPVILQLKAQTTGTITKNVLVHAELSKVLALSVRGSVMVN